MSETLTDCAVIGTQSVGDGDGELREDQKKKTLEILTPWSTGIKGTERRRFVIRTKLPTMGGFGSFFSVEFL